MFHWQVRVFDLVRELAFAGHPLLCAAAVLHARRHVEDASLVKLHVCPRRLQTMATP
jgi:predicted PhzF superfamily epimerase YddE/YHI9